MSHLSDLIAYADGVRQKMEVIVAETDPTLEICPGWTIKEAVGHITAWEIAIHKAILAYKAGDPPYFLPEQDFDLFNQGAVSVRADWPIDDVVTEWRTVRDQLRDTILSLDENELDEDLVLPWGSERTVAELIEILGEHEGEHLENIIKAKG